MHRCLWLIALAGCAACSPPENGAPTVAYDLVIQAGRVINPETQLDAIRNVGINDGRIAAVSEQPLAGAEVVDAAGLIVAPGFINLHSHAWTPLGQSFELQDGVTTALELESGSYPASAFGTYEPIALANRSRPHFGASLGHAWIRSAILEGADSVTGFEELVAGALNGSGDGLSMERPAFRQALDSDQKAELRSRLNSGLDAGGLGIGMLLDYMNEVVDSEEMQVIFEVAGARQAPIFVHIRRGVAGDTAGLIEVIELAKTTGAPVHICHLQASAMQNVTEFMRLVREANAAGAKVTMESFPYNAGSTSISAAVFNRDWQKIFAITYKDVEWLATGERLTEEKWNKYRQEAPGGIVVHHYNREEWTRLASIAPDVIVASDGQPIISLESKTIPFGIGTNSRIYARYVREEGSLDLMTAVAKMTLLPARVLENYSEAFTRKGRLSVGADADLTIFDLDTIQDHATFSDPFQASTGIAHVIVGGKFALRDGKLLEDSFPGTRILK